MPNMMTNIMTEGKVAAMTLVIAEVMAEGLVMAGAVAGTSDRIE